MLWKDNYDSSSWIFHWNWTLKLTTTTHILCSSNISDICKEGLGPIGPCSFCTSNSLNISWREKKFHQFLLNKCVAKCSLKTEFPTCCQVISKQNDRQRLVWLEAFSTQKMKQPGVEMMQQFCAKKKKKKNAEVLISSEPF